MNDCVDHSAKFLSASCDAMNTPCKWALPDVGSIEEDFRSGLNLIRLLQALRLARQPKRTYRVTARPKTTVIRETRAIAIDKRRTSAPHGPGMANP